MSTTQPPDSSGGATPGGKTCCSPSLHRAARLFLASVVFAEPPLRGPLGPDLVYMVTFVRCAVTTVCSVCGEVRVVEIDAAEV